MASSTCTRAQLAIALLAVALCNAAFLVVVVDAGYPRGGDYRAQFLFQQNAARAAMGLPALRWDERVAAYARSYAESRRGDCALVHSSGPYGENLFWCSGTGWAPAQAVGAWLAERRRYDYWSNRCSGGMCGHGPCPAGGRRAGRRDGGRAGAALLGRGP